MKRRSGRPDRRTPKGRKLRIGRNRPTYLALFMTLLTFVAIGWGISEYPYWSETQATPATP